MKRAMGSASLRISSVIASDSTAALVLEGVLLVINVEADVGVCTSMSRSSDTRNWKGCGNSDGSRSSSSNYRRRYTVVLVPLHVFLQTLYLSFSFSLLERSFFAFFTYTYNKL